MKLIPPLVYSDSLRLQVLMHVIGTGWVREVDHIAKHLGLQRKHVERALQELVDDAWVLPDGDERWPESPRLNRQRPGFQSMVDFLYVEHGVRLGEPRGQRATRGNDPFRRDRGIPLIDADIDDSAVTVAELRHLRLALLAQLDAHPDWDAAMQMLYARDSNQRARDMIHGFLPQSEITAALRLLDVSEETADRGRRWITALQLIDASLATMQEYVTRLVDAYDTASRYDRALGNWILVAGAMPAVLEPYPARGGQDPISLGNHLAAIRRGAFIDGYHYRHGGTPSPEQVGTVGEVAVAASVVELAGRLRTITIRAADQNPLAEQLGLTWRSVALPDPDPGPRSLPRITDRRARYLPMPPTHQVIDIPHDELRAGDYLVAVDGRRLQSPALVLTRPSGELGQFEAVSIDIDPKLRQILADDLTPVWLGFTAGWSTRRIQVGRAEAP